MRKTKYFSTFFRYVIMNVWGMVGLSCYILADTFFIAKGLGSDGLPALNLAIPVYSFVHGIGLMFGMGGAVMATGMAPLISMGILRWHKKQGKQQFVLKKTRFSSTMIEDVVKIGTPSLITAVFNSEQNKLLQKIAVAGMKLYFIAVPFIGFNIVTSVF